MVDALHLRILLPGELKITCVMSSLHLWILNRCWWPWMFECAALPMVLELCVELEIWNENLKLSSVLKSRLDLKSTTVDFTISENIPVEWNHYTMWNIALSDVLTAGASRLLAAVIIISHFNPRLGAESTGENRSVGSLTKKQATSCRL